MELSLETDLIRKKLNLLSDLSSLLESIVDTDFYEEIFPDDEDGLIYEQVNDLRDTYRTEVHELDRQRLKEYSELIRNQ